MFFVLRPRFVGCSLSTFSLLSFSAYANIISQQCLQGSLSLSANLACSQSGSFDIVSPINLHSFQSYPNILSSRQNIYNDDDLLEESISAAPAWTYEPVCSNYMEPEGSILCAYTNSSFSHSRGISIFTTPKIAAQFASVPPFHDNSALNGINDIGLDENDRAWYTEFIPGKGMGVLASRDLKRGDRIMATTPVLLLYMESALSTGEREMFLRTAVERLPRETAEHYDQLAKIYGDERVKTQDVVKANAFEMQVGGVMHLGVFPEASRINHACGPNAQYHLEPDRLTHYVHATRDIKKDEEITISYSPPFDDGDTRHGKLEESFHFSCTCSRCLSRTESDTRLREIVAIQKILTNFQTPAARELATPSLALRLIGLYEKEGLEGFLDTAYGYTALMYSVKGNKDETKRYAGLAAESVRLKEGPGSPDESMWREMIEDVGSHWTWRWWDKTV